MQNKTNKYNKNPKNKRRLLRKRNKRVTNKTKNSGTYTGDMLGSREQIDTSQTA